MEGKKMTTVLRLERLAIPALLLVSLWLQAYANGREVPISLMADSWSGELEQTTDRKAVCEVREVEGGLEFVLAGTAGFARTAGWKTSFEPFPIGETRYLVMEYRAARLNNRGGEVLGVELTDDSGKESHATLLKLHDLLVDGKRHTVVVTAGDNGIVRALSVRVHSRSSEASLTVHSLRFVSSPNRFPTVLGAKAIPAPDGPYECLDLSSRYDAEYQRVLNQLLGPLGLNDAGAWFSTPLIGVGAVPYRVRPDGGNLVTFPAGPGENDQIVDHFGMKLKRGYVAPVSRDGKVEIEVGRAVTEVFFLLAVEHPTISAVDPSRRDFRIEDVECFAVELKYADGATDFAFPFSMLDGRHVIQGTVGAYAVPASGRELRSVVLHSRILNKNMYLAAVTVNKGTKRLFPRLAAPSPSFAASSKTRRTPVSQEAYIRYTGGHLDVGNGSISLQIDPSRAFSLTRLVNPWLGDSAISLDPSIRGLQVSLQEEPLPMIEPRLVKVSEITGSGEKQVTITYSLPGDTPLEFTVTLSINDRDPEIGLRLSALNQSDQPVNARILFPAFAVPRLGRLEDVWYMYPSFRAILGNQYGTYEHLYSLSFPMQFYDVYNPKLGGGFYLATRETDVDEVRRFGLSKSAAGVSCGIEYPFLHTHLKPKERLELSKTVIGFHPGDWHAAADRYSEWLRTWYRPVKAQNKGWYRGLYWLLCDYMDTVHPQVRTAIRESFAGWYDGLTKRYRMKEILDEHKRTVGRYPDIFHFWSWTWNMPKGYRRWGAYGTNGEYESLGGLDNFRAAIGDLKKGTGSDVSIYLDASLCNPDLPIARRLGSQAVIQSRDGKPVWDYGVYRMCPGSPGWREYMQDVYRRVHKELDVNILYVDEWAAPWYYGRDPIRAFNCWAPDHDHTQPANMNAAVREYMRELREAVPESAALYGEYQDVDVNTQFYDGAINYYLTQWAADPAEGRDSLSYDRELADTGLAQTYLNLYRYLLPGQVTLSLPNDVAYYSWHPLKFTFLNGDSVYDSFWGRDESKAEAFMVKSFDLKKEYSDCFRSDHPEMMVPTENPSIIANLFPGNRRKLWTLYNYGYTTARGAVLRIPNVKGARYFDVWNDRELQPETKGDEATISLTIHPQDVGCVLQTSGEL
jgi:hypothetical protein